MNGKSTSPIILICDHASRRFPAALKTMGLDPVARRCHLALDIGAGALTERLAKMLSATAVLCQYSRLVVDCNRQLMDPSAFLEFGDGIVVPGNRNLHPEEKKARADEIYWPYHHAIESQLERLGAQGRPPIFVSVHSFTPVLNGESRPWEMGVLWDTDRVTAEIFVHDLSQAGFHVGDNEPYSGKSPQDFTIDHHAEAIGLPHVGIEIRQDLIDDDQ
ncbi:MAG: N-formylglutamate amidohydrolase, partial [Proteobacteria bacterium]|nr:N-formylglutamate amidohydrolase [Pseudomonadota bacterium]